MRKKPLTKDEFEKTYKEDEETTFDVDFSSIKDPREIILKGALYNPLSVLVGGTTGTSYGFVVDSHRIKIYLYSLDYQNGIGRIEEINKSKYKTYHHIKSIKDIKKIPDYIRKAIPNESMSKIHIIIENESKGNQPNL